MFGTHRFVQGFTISVAAFMFLSACSEDDPGPPMPKLYGVTCLADDDCESSLCVDAHCSKRCSKLSDCPSVRTFDPKSEKTTTYEFVCGRVRDTTDACHPKQYDDQDHATGFDCSVGGEMDCAVGWKCLGVDGDTNRYCSPICESDRNCPPTYRCATVTFAKDDAPEMRCLKRQYGHPCVIDDHCGGPEDLCITDANGNKYCGKACEGVGTCPPFAQCMDAGNNKRQCKHRAGFTYKQDAELCEPCIVHYEPKIGDSWAGDAVVEPGQCVEDGRCILFSPYSGETGCATSCTIETCTPGEENCTDDGKRFICPDGFACTNSEPNVCVPVVEGEQGLEIGTCNPTR